MIHLKNMRKVLIPSIFLLVSLVLVNCGGGGGGGGSAPPSAVSVRITPGNVSLTSVRIQPFTASVSGSSNIAVNWSLQGTGSGTITPNGIYMAPSTAGIYTVVATSQADTSKSATATVTVNNSVPRFAYSANKTDGTVSIYTVNAATGQLRANGYVIGGISPVSVAVDPKGQFVYVANSGSNSISEFSVTSSSSLSSIGTMAAGNLNGPSSLAIDPSGKYLFVSNAGINSVSSYSIGSSGTLTLIGNITVGTVPQTQKLEVDPSGRFVYIVNNNDNTITALAIGNSGALTLIGTFFTGTGPSTLAVDPLDRFVYVTDSASGDILTYSIGNTGALSRVATITAGIGYTAVTVDSTGKYTYAANPTSNTVVAYSITSTGSLSSLGAVSTGNSPSSIKVDPTGKFLYVTNSGDNTISIYGISGTGTLTGLGTMRTQGGPASIALGSGGTAINYVPKCAYVANYTSGDVYAYTISTSGQLVQNGTATAGTNPYSVAVEPTDRFAYVVNFTSNNISQYNISGSGALSAQSVVTVSSGSPADSGPVSIAIDPSGQYVYVAYKNSNTVAAFNITSNGSLSYIGSYSTGSGPYFVTVDPTGKFVYVANSNNIAGGNSVSGYTINFANGSLTPQISNPFSLGTSTSPFSIAVDPTGRFLYTANYGGDVSLCIISTTGSLTCQSAAAQLNSNYSVVADPTGKYLYVANYTNNNIWGYSIDPTSGLLTQLSGSPFTILQGFTPNPYSISIDPSGAYIYTANSAGGTIGVWGGAITTSTGALSVGSNFTAGSGPQAILTTGIIQ